MCVCVCVCNCFLCCKHHTPSYLVYAEEYFKVYYVAHRIVSRASEHWRPRGLTAAVPNRILALSTGCGCCCPWSLDSRNSDTVAPKEGQLCRQNWFLQHVRPHTTFLWTEVRLHLCSRYKESRKSGWWHQLWGDRSHDTGNFSYVRRLFRRCWVTVNMTNAHCGTRHDDSRVRLEDWVNTAGQANSVSQTWLPEINMHHEVTIVRAAVHTWNKNRQSLKIIWWGKHHTPLRKNKFDWQMIWNWLSVWKYARWASSIL